MCKMLDDMSVMQQYDSGATRHAALEIARQTAYAPELQGEARRDVRVTSVVIAGMGGSALAADMVRVLTRGWLQLPLEVVKGYELPGYAGRETLVIAISHSGNTEETLQCYADARQRGCVLAAVASGGRLLEMAAADNMPHIQVPHGSQPRMSSVYHLKALLRLLEQHSIIDAALRDEITASGDWLQAAASLWRDDVPIEQNAAKQLARQLVGKTSMFYAGELTWPLAYKWKISCNESAKNMAFWNQYPEFNHNEFMGWTSHPVDKPFAVVDLRSNLERPRITERMVLSDRLLSGKRPKAHVVKLEGETLLQQLLWGMVLADITSIYMAILNQVNPEPVVLIETLKKMLS